MHKTKCNHINQHRHTHSYHCTPNHKHATHSYQLTPTYKSYWHPCEFAAWSKWSELSLSSLISYHRARLATRAIRSRNYKHNFPRCVSYTYIHTHTHTHTPTRAYTYVPMHNYITYAHL